MFEDFWICNLNMFQNYNKPLHKVANGDNRGQQHKKEYQILVDELLTRTHFAARYFTIQR